MVCLAYISRLCPYRCWNLHSLVYLRLYTRIRQPFQRSVDPDLGTRKARFHSEVCKNLQLDHLSKQLYGSPQKLLQQIGRKVLCAKNHLQTFRRYLEPIRSQVAGQGDLDSEWYSGSQGIQEYSIGN